MISSLTSVKKKQLNNIRSANKEDTVKMKTPRIVLS